MERFSDHYGRGKWVVFDRRRGEITSTWPSGPQARRSVRNDTGRVLEIQDPVGRLDSMWRDGRELAGEAA